MIEEEATAEPKKVRRKGIEIKSPSRRRNIEDNSAHLQNVGRMLPGFPMTAEELMAQWEIPADAAYEIMVKVQKIDPHAGDLGLIHETVLAEYSGRDLARKFGPGTYYLRPPAGIYSRKSAKVVIQPQYADTCGWGKLAPSAADALAVRTLEAAGKGPTDPVDLIAAIERMMDRKLAEAGIQRGVPMVQGAGVIDPNQMMAAQFAQVERTMEMMSRLEQRAIETVQRRMGMAPKDEEGAEDDGGLWPSLLKQALPILGKILDARQAPPAQPTPAQVIPPPTLPGPDPATSAVVPMLTPEEQKVMGPVVGMLKPFAASLIEMGKRHTDPANAAKDLAPWIQPALYGNLEAVAEIVKAKGPAVLGLIHPDLASDHWGAILRELVVELQREEP